MPASTIQLSCVRCGAAFSVRAAEHRYRSSGKSKYKPATHCSISCAKRGTDHTCPTVPDDFGNWLAGLADGEGYFQIGNVRGRPFLTFGIALRSDDLPVLEYIRQTIGFGSIFLKNRAIGRNPTHTWQVQSIGDCVAIAALFAKYPLRAKKRRDCALWSEAATLMQDGKAHWPRVDELGRELVEVRRFPTTLD